MGAVKVSRVRLNMVNALSNSHVSCHRSLDTYRSKSILFSVCLILHNSSTLTLVGKGLVF